MTKMHKPCVLEQWIEQEVTEDKITDPEKHMDDTVNEVADEVQEVLWKKISGNSEVGLFNTLRGAHIALASQLGIIEAWMRKIMEGQENVPLGLIDEEREKLLGIGQRHVSFHFEEEPGPKTVH